MLSQIESRTERSSFVYRIRLVSHPSILLPGNHGQRPEVAKKSTVDTLHFSKVGRHPVEPPNPATRKQQRNRKLAHVSVIY